MADTFDIYFQAKSPDHIEGFKFFTFGFDRTVAVRGFWKLITHWLKRFMTPKGTDPLRPEDGTDFMNLIGSNITVFADIRDVVLLAISDCNEQLATVQQETQPALDETLDSAVLTGFETVGDDGFDAYVTISNLAGESIQVRLPDLATRS